MGNFRPIPTKCWEKFLTSKGYSYSRTSSSHDEWTKHGCRTIPVWGNEKEIPGFHLQTSCRTLGCTLKEVYKWIEENC